MQPDNLRIDAKRLWDSIMRIGEIGPGTAGGSSRQALTDDDKAARDLFTQWCRDENCAITIDDMGNIFARRAGREDIPPICAGSHLDTQPHGGKFDGVYGVIAALEVVRTLNQHDIQTTAPLEIVVWSNEEGCRFAPAMLASGVFAGLFEKDFAYARQDADGKRYDDELKRIGYYGDQPCGEHPLGALFEAHIEQGPILQRNDNVVGVVSGGQGLSWFDVTVRGQDAHAGPTPMQGRKDALAAAAQMITAVRDIALDNAPHAVGTVGQLCALPNSRNTIAGETQFSVDLRHPDEPALKAMNQMMFDRCQQIAAAHGVTVDIDSLWHNPPAQFDAQCVNAVRDAATMLQLRHQDIVSGAGHDACQICRRHPVAMIFVPCKDGVSHNEQEWAEPDALAAGCNVLLHAMLGVDRLRD